MIDVNDVKLGAIDTFDNARLAAGYMSQISGRATAEIVIAGAQQFKGHAASRGHDVGGHYR